jgi:hypothetical protein
VAPAEAQRAGIDSVLLLTDPEDRLVPMDTARQKIR